jgi:hypothetical protein
MMETSTLSARTDKSINHYSNIWKATHCSISFMTLQIANSAVANASEEL